jgi:hypothetical protein
MGKRGISITLDAANITWLKARSRAVNGRGVSELIDQLVTEARVKTPAGPVRSVAGTIDIDASDPLLTDARTMVREILDASLMRPIAVKETRASYRARTRTPGRA